MPPGTPYHSFIPPYPIRVDEFTDPKNEEIRVPALHLLTHTHSDHVIGLNAKSFGGTIVCSIDAKEMLLRHETYTSRYKYDQDYQSEKNKTYSHLKTRLWIPRPGQADAAAQCVESRDLLVCVRGTMT
jgi:glyoxylase-like metal-dependent hydrolase (beta-lactamase superfamily II)